jgi:two-component system sensor histidine kinase AlgZ
MLQNNPTHSTAAELIPDLCQVRAVLWLVLFSEALVIVLILLSSGAFDFSWELFGTLSFYVLWVVLISAACLCRVRLHVGRLTLNQLMLISFIIILLINLLVSLVSMWGLNHFLFEDYGWDWLLRNQFVTVILAALLLHYFHAQLQSRLRLRSEMQARLQALQSRIRPHFLFNSMNIIASLIHVDSDKAEQAVEDLSELFRASLKEAGVEVSLKQELDLCKKYIHIESLRLNERLQVKWQVTAPLTIKIPMLTLQPIIENAIYYGIQPSAKGGLIDISICYENSRVIILVKNPLPTDAANVRHEKGNQMALDNIRHRLHALYGEDVTMDTVQEAASFVMQISYPCYVKGVAKLKKSGEPS